MRMRGGLVAGLPPSTHLNVRRARRSVWVVRHAIPTPFTSRPAKHIAIEQERHKTSPELAGAGVSGLCRGRREEPRRLWATCFHCRFARGKIVVRLLSGRFGERPRRDGRSEAVTELPLRPTGRQVPHHFRMRSTLYPRLHARHDSLRFKDC